MARARWSAVWSGPSRADLDQIWLYHEHNAGQGTAERMIGQIRKAVLLIEEHLFAGRSRDEIYPGLRSIVASPYVVFYRIPNAIPEIVRVLDARQDIDDLFVDQNRQRRSIQ